MKIPKHPRDPQYINEDSWYYEYPKGIELYGRLPIGTVIPYSILAATMKRHRAIVANKKAKARKGAGK